MKRHMDNILHVFICSRYIFGLDSACAEQSRRFAVAHAQIQFTCTHILCLWSVHYIFGVQCCVAQGSSILAGP